MDVLILAGGKGSRLAELTHETPKGLAQIGGRPILWHIMSIFARHGHTRFVLCVGYEGQQIADYFAGPGATPGWEVQTSNAGVAATKSQRVQAALAHVRSDRFWLSYGDDLSDVDLAAVDARARATESIATLTAVQPYSPFGVMDIEADSAGGRVAGFREKCRMTEWINGGFMSVDRRIEGYLGLGELEKEVFEALVQEGRLNVHRHHGFWKAMNTHKEYLELNEMQAAGELAWIQERAATES